MPAQGPYNIWALHLSRLVPIHIQ